MRYLEARLECRELPVLDRRARQQPRHAESGIRLISELFAIFWRLTQMLRTPLTGIVLLRMLSWVGLTL